ncbi:hypothetical protein BDN72DRAFT_934991 [Pluteus cervinus]|uniref:Uncharacterized protein n=1 Tax=Pluteus cervinus TaxID=181527 RepID=A0ACD3A7C4_9AGAR|nr:hypothetical protein BDN72DRAFT_934991 [Pluteus cervinus]
MVLILDPREVANRWPFVVVPFISPQCPAWADLRLYTRPILMWIDSKVVKRARERKKLQEELKYRSPRTFDVKSKNFESNENDLSKERLSCSGTRILLERGFKCFRNLRGSRKGRWHQTESWSRRRKQTKTYDKHPTADPADQNSQQQVQSLLGLNTGIMSPWIGYLARSWKNGRGDPNRVNSPTKKHSLPTLFGSRKNNGITNLNYPSPLPRADNIVHQPYVLSPNESGHHVGIEVVAYREGAGGAYNKGEAGLVNVETLMHGKMGKREEVWSGDCVDDVQKRISACTRPIDDDDVLVFKPSTWDVSAQAPRPLMSVNELLSTVNDSDRTIPFGLPGRASGASAMGIGHSDVWSPTSTKSTSAAVVRIELGFDGVSEHALTVRPEVPFQVQARLESLNVGSSNKKMAMRGGRQGGYMSWKDTPPRQLGSSFPQPTPRYPPQELLDLNVSSKRHKHLLDPRIWVVLRAEAKKADKLRC